MFGLDALFSDLERAVYVIGVLVLLTVVLVVIVLVLLLWSKYSALPAPAKALVALAAGVVFLMVAVIVGWVAESAVVAAYEDLVRLAVAAVRWYDGWTRRHPIVPVLWLMATVPLLWPTLRKNSLDEDE